MGHWFKFLCEWGYGLTRKNIIDFVCGYLHRTNQSDIFKNARPGNDWFYAFLNGWSKEISTRKTHNLTSTRVVSCTQEMIDIYFEVVT